MIRPVSALRAFVRVRFQECDPLGHVNNAAYLHAVEEHVTARPDLLTAPHRLVIEYRAPITAGEHLALRRRDDDESSTVWFVVNGESRATARMARL